MRNDKEILDRMTTLMSIQGKKHKDLISYLGLTKGTYSNWLRKQSISFLCYLEDISKYLNVPVSYLVTGETTGNLLANSDEDDEIFLKKYHSLSMKSKTMSGAWLIH